MRSYGCFFEMTVVGGLMSLLLVAGLPPAAAAGSCEGWDTPKFFKSATVEEVTACLSAGRDPNQQDRQGLTALHRAARETGDPAVIEALLEAGANPRASTIAFRLPWHFARKTGKIKGSEAYQRLRLAPPQKADWSGVQAVPHNRKTEVQLYKDEASQGNRKIKGRFDSATADSITLRLKDGQTRTIEKQAVSKVLTRGLLLTHKSGVDFCTCCVSFLGHARAKSNRGHAHQCRRHDPVEGVAGASRLGQPDRVRPPRVPAVRLP